MKFIKKLFLSVSILLLFSNFNLLQKGERVLLVLKEPIGSFESFSVFQVREVDGVLVGINIDEYPISNGVYKVEATSNSKFYRKKILILSN